MANNIKHINLNSPETQSDGVKVISLSDTGAGGGVTPVTSWQNPPTDTDVPSEKLVYDSLGKYGVISQTQDWTQAADGSYDYTIAPASIVRGIIPQANIDLFVAAGAVFDATTGYFQLNGLTDISYEEMQAIYNYARMLDMGLFSASSVTYGGSDYNFRVNFGVGILHLYLFSAGTNFSYQFYNNRTIEKIVIQRGNSPISGSGWGSMCSGCEKLREVSGIISVANRTNANDIKDMFQNCFSLETISIYGLKANFGVAQSSPLSLASVVYMVVNAANTSAITITLHATAYARCQADTTEYTYQGNTYTGILALATAHNITIASA